MNLSIPNPCHEKPDNMVPNKDGMYCFSCKKNVYDLTKFSNNQIEDLFIKNKGGLCIKISQHQIDNYNTFSPHITRFFSLRNYKARIASAVSLVFVSFLELTQKTAVAQNTISVQKNILEDSIVKKSNQNKSIFSDVEFKFIVVDDKNESVIGAIIDLKGGGGGAATDIDGIGRLLINDFNINNEYTTLCSYAGHNTVTTKLNINNKEVRIVMKMDTTLNYKDVISMGYMPYSKLKNSISAQPVNGISPSGNQPNVQTEKCKAPGPFQRIKTFFIRIF